jgi:hypothetical protein
MFSILSAGVAPVEFDWTCFELKISTTEQTGVHDMLYKALFAIQYDGTRTVADYVSSHPGIAETIRKNIRTTTRMQQNFLTDGGTEYVHRLSLTKGIMHALLPRSQPVHLLVPMLCPCCGQAWPEDKPIPDSIELLPQQTERTDYTGIVFDCGEYKLTPCLFMKVVAPDGREVYSVNFASLNSVEEWGLVHYSTRDDFTTPRAGPKPLVIPIIGISNSKQTDIVISFADARRIHGSKGNLQLLQECRVIIVSGP